MPLAIDYSRQAEKFLSRVGGKEGRQLGEKITALSNDPHPQDAQDVKGHPGLYRADQGEFRIVYEEDGSTLVILVVERRNDDEVYKLLKRLYG